MTLREYCLEAIGTIDGLDDQGRAELVEDHIEDLLTILASVGHVCVDPDYTEVGPLLRESRRWLEMLLETL